MTGDERLSDFLEELTDGALARNYRLLSFENEFPRGILSIRIYFLDLGIGGIMLINFDYFTFISEAAKDLLL